MVECFERMIAFLDTNGEHDNWLVHLECFDPHEPFTAPEKYRALYPACMKVQFLIGRDTAGSKKPKKKLPKFAQTMRH